MKYLNFSINKFNEYQYTILIIFIVIISLILNIKTNKNIKIVLLVLSLIICFFHPTLLIPFGSSLYILYLINRNKRKNKNIRESFENGINQTDYYNLANYLNNPSKKIFDYQKFLKIYENDDFKNFIEINKDISDPIYIKKKYNFIIELSKCYFFDLYNEKDYNLILKLNEKYDSVKRIYEDLEFINIFQDEESVLDKKRDSQINLLKNKSLKKLGLYFYKGKFKEINNYLNESIYNLGLYSITNNLYEIRNIENDNYSDTYLDKVINKNKLEKKEYNILKKKINELVLIIFYEQNKTIETINEGTSDETKIEYFDFNKMVVLDEIINIFKTFTENYINEVNKDEKDIQNLNYIKLYQTLNYINDSFLRKIRKFKKNKDNKIINEEYDLNKSLKLFPTIYKKNYIPVNNDKDLEQNIDYIIDEAITNIENLDLLSLNFYNSINKKDRKKQQIIVHNNLSIFFILSNSNINQLLEDIYKNDNLNIMFRKIHQRKSKLFQTQLENEKSVEDKYIFTDISDIYFDNIFYYYNLKYTDENITKTFPKEIQKDLEIVDVEPLDLEEDTIEENPFVQLDDLERKLNTYISDKPKKEKQEDALNKYYELIDKDNYEKIKTLNSLAENREKELKLEELKFDKVVDDFGSEVYNIIDDVIELFSNKNDTFSEDNSKNSLDRYTSYIYNLILILTRDNRILYTGFIFIVIAFFIYFISDEGKNHSYPINNPSLLQRFL